MYLIHFYFVIFFREAITIFSQYLCEIVAEISFICIICNYNLDVYQIPKFLFLGVCMCIIFRGEHRTVQRNLMSGQANVWSDFRSVASSYLEGVLYKKLSV